MADRNNLSVRISELESLNSRLLDEIKQAKQEKVSLERRYADDKSEWQKKFEVSFDCTLK